jgi:hypothetical protein
MRNPLPIFMGKVDDTGRLYIDRKSDFLAYLRGLKGAVEVIVKKHRRTRTLDQNAYYWVAITPKVAEHLTRIGGRQYSPEEAHEVLKLEFNPKRVTTLQGVEGVIGGSTATMDSFQFSIYLEKIIEWGAGSGISFPSSDEYYQNG